MQNASPGRGHAQTAARGLRHAQASPALQRRQTLSPHRQSTPIVFCNVFRGGRMRWQKEKGLAPQKKNLKPQRESEARIVHDEWGFMTHVLKRSSKRIALLISLAFAFAASASAREIRIQKFSAEIFVQPDSALDVTETIEANFIGVWHGLYRSIPIQYVTPQGFNYTLFVKLEGATDAAGQTLKVESSREGHYLKWKIYVDGATDVERTIHLHYQV